MLQPSEALLKKIKNVGELRKILRENQGFWQVASHFVDTDSLPEYGLGTSPEGLIPATLTFFHDSRSG